MWIIFSILLIGYYGYNLRKPYRWYRASGKLAIFLIVIEICYIQMRLSGQPREVWRILALISFVGILGRAYMVYFLMDDYNDDDIHYD